ncbi:MAG: SDR family oxidoreductase [Xanthobacteraceae bacterium]|nr:SDR family oxidoreductase [Xanthobacteraceae bacterium]MCW5673169.1 SDR family oxidoreductase [Xanthobacteraceae bacterium]
MSRVTVITGASGGIGEELAYCAAKAERKLVLVARSSDKLKTVAEKIAALGAPAPEIVALDLADPKSGEMLVSALAQKNLKVFELINNAGYGLAGPVEQLDRADQVGMVDLNMRALTDLTLRFLPEIIAANGGVMNVASTAAFQPGPNMAIYYASKAYVLSFSEAIWFELRGRARVTCLCPGPTPTGFSARAKKDGKLRLMNLSMTSAAFVASRGWERFQRGQRVVVPGVMNEIAATLAPLSPKALVLWLASRLSR